MGHAPTPSNDQSAPAQSTASAARLGVPERDQCLALIHSIRFGQGRWEAEDNAGDAGDRDLDREHVGTVTFEGIRVTCPNGHTTTITKDGRGRRGEQRYLCQDCQKSFSALTGTVFDGRQFTLFEMVYIISRMDDTPATEIADVLPQSYRSVRAFIKSVQAATPDSPLVEAFRTDDILESL